MVTILSEVFQQVVGNKKLASVNRQQVVAKNRRRVVAKMSLGHKGKQRGALQRPRECVVPTLKQLREQVASNSEVLDLKQFEKQMDGFEMDNGLLNNLKQLIIGAFKSTDIPSHLIIGLTLNVVSMITLLISFIKTKSKLSLALLVSSIIQLICYIFQLMNLKVDEQIVKGIESYFSEPEEIYDIDGNQMTKIKVDKSMSDYFYECKLLERPLTKRKILDLYRTSYMGKFNLPVIYRPHEVLNSLDKREMKENLWNIPDWYLMAYNDCEFHEIIEWRHQAMNDNSGKPCLKGCYKCKTTDQIRFQQQTNFYETLSNFKGLFAKIICLLMYVLDCAINKQKFSMTSMMLTLRPAQAVEAGLSDVEKLYNVITNKEDPTLKHLETLETYGSKLNAYLEMPTYLYSKYPKNRSDCRNLLNDFATFYNGLSQNYRAQALSTHGLYAALNARFTNIMNTEIQVMSRQEPFLVLLRGAGGIGKTQFAKWLIRKLCEQYNYILQESVIEISPDDKYWPPLSNQEIVFFDEAASKRDFREDLLFNNLKALCSPAFFNAAGADIQHKINPFTAKIMIATTNTEFNDISNRVVSNCDANTWQAMCRRMIIIDCTRSESFNKMDINHPQPSDFDPTGFSHLKLGVHEFANGKLQPTVFITPNTLIHNIKEREARFKREFDEKMEAERLLMARRETSKDHLSIVLHGRMGQGKTHIVNEIRNTLGNALNMPITFISDWDILNSHRSTKREIIILDDIIRTTLTSIQEDKLMTFFNSVLHDNSIIIWTTNVTPKSPYLAYYYNNSYISKNITLPFKNEGLTRRIGYSGSYNGSLLPITNCEIYVNNFKAYVIDRTSKFEFNKVFGSYWNVYKIFIPFWLIYNLYIYLKPTVSEISISKLPEFIFNKYTQFLAGRKAIRVEYRDGIGCNGDFNIKIFGESSKTIFTGGIGKFMTRLYTNIVDYERSSEDWKIFMLPQIKDLMASNIERFLIRTDMFDEEYIISVIKKYVIALVELDKSPRLFARIEDIGIFLYEDGVLYINRTGVIQDQPITLVEYNGNILLSIGNKEMPLTDLIRNPSSSYDTYRCNMSESVQIKQFLSSSQFLNHRLAQTCFNQMRKQDIQNSLVSAGIATKKLYSNFTSSLGGKICIVLISIYSLILLSTKLCDWIYGEDENKVQQKKTLKKGTPKRRNYDSDDEVHQEKKTLKKGTPKRRNYDSDDERKELKTAVKEDVLTLTDVNGFDTIMPHIGEAFKKARRNLCQIYSSLEITDTLNEEPNGVACYGLFVAQNIIVTVGHIRDLKEWNYYCGIDGTNKFFKMTLLKSYKMRDLSVWTVNIPHMMPDITRLFFYDEYILDGCDVNACIQRFGENKREEYHCGDFSYRYGPTAIEDGKIESYGECAFGVCDIQITTYGDCGLPYYCAERDPLLRNRILGIHCMGSVSMGRAFGITACIFQTDIIMWKNLAANIKPQNNCGFCTTGEFAYKEDINPKAIGHMNVWHRKHESTLERFIEELKFHKKIRPGFLGLIIKNSGILFGSQSHSHTQFLLETLEYQYIDEIGEVCAWKNFDNRLLERKIDEDLSYKIVSMPLSEMFKALHKYKFINPDFRIRALIYKNKEDEPYVKMEIITLKKYITSDSYDKQMNVVAFDSNLGSPVYATEDIRLILDGAKNNLKRGKQEDIPFNKVINNQTVKVIGSFVQTKSHLPNQKYVLSPFSDIVKDIIPIDKMPTEYNIDKIPKEELEKMVVNNYGQPCQLATQAIKWAHKSYGNKFNMAKYTKMFKSKVLRTYSGMRLLSDHEVLHGLDKKEKLAHCILGLETDSAIGFTLKELFYVNKKSDVISVDEHGNYRWQDNMAADYLKQMYEYSKTLQDNGEKYFSVFTEMLKMEKLKISKRYLGRTFVAQDTLGVLLERRALGMFAARAMGSDPNCGVGVDPSKDFDSIYKYLNKHPNLWAGDYSNFDRSIPASVMYEIRDVLAECNPQIANQIISTFNVLIERIQVTGKTIAEIYGGLPSGCYVTAPLNSIINDYVLFVAFCDLCFEQHIEVSYKLYDMNVSRKFYGDDVIISVSDEFKDIFNRRNVSKILLDKFGMQLNSSDKDGIGNDFDTYETASWISRYFRRLEPYPFVCGALKKISIHANFHYVTSNSLEHLGSLMSKALYEASFWEKEYFYKIQEAVVRCINHKPALAKYIDIEDLDFIRENIFKLNAPIAIYKQATWFDWAEDVENTEVLQREKELEQKELVPDVKIINFFSKYYFTTKYYKSVIKSLELKRQIKMNAKQMALTYVSRVNEMFQKGKISKPNYTIDNSDIQTSTWRSTLEIDNKNYVGYGFSKMEAKEESAYLFLIGNTAEKHLKTMKQKISLEDFKKEMMTTPSKQIPKPTMTNVDSTVTTDSGIFTSTDAPTPFKVMNSTAIALDNPCGSGAPFSKQDACYNIYQRWDSKNGVISPSLANGTTFLRISLDPNEYPAYLRDYVLMHEAIIPSIEVVVAIAGAAGSVGWITCGWVKDASRKDYTLEEIQQIASETSNMNGTQVIKFQIDDIRKNGLYRALPKDPEPYPGIIFMIDQQVTNVQRTDAVNYPFRVQVRLGKGCVLMSPFVSNDEFYKSVGASSGRFDLGSYLTSKVTDCVVLASSISNNVVQPKTVEDCGLWTGKFRPSFENIVQVVYPKERGVIAMFNDVPSSSEVSKSVEIANNMNSTDAYLIPPSILIFGYGKIPTLPYCVDEKAWKYPDGTIYNVAPTNVKFGYFNYLIDKLVVVNDGCLIIMKADVDIKSEVTSDNKHLYIFKNCHYKADKYLDSATPFINATTRTTLPTLYYSNTGELVGDDIPSYDYRFESTLLNANQIITLSYYLATGNTIGTTLLPTGLKQLVFMTPGTSTNIAKDIGLAPIQTPGIISAINGLNNYMIYKQYNRIKGDIVVDGQNIGEFGYSNGIFLVKTDLYYKIRTEMSTNIILTNIVSIDDFNELSTINLLGFQNWSTSPVIYRERKLCMDLSNFQKQSAIAAGVIQGLGNGIGTWAQNNWQEKMMNSMWKYREAMQAANNEAIMARQQKAFENNLNLMGYSSASVQSGGLSSNQNRNGLGYQPFVYGGTYTQTPMNIDPKKMDQIKKMMSKENGTKDEPKEENVGDSPIINDSEPDVVKEDTKASFADQYKQQLPAAIDKSFGNLKNDQSFMADHLTHLEQGLNEKNYPKFWDSGKPNINPFASPVNELSGALGKMTDAIQVSNDYQKSTGKPVDKINI